MSRRLPLLALALVFAACSRPAPVTQIDPTPTDLVSVSSVPHLRNLERLAMEGNAAAAFEAGAIYHDGLGTAKDLPKAEKYFAIAANAGERRARYNLGIMALHGENGPEDPATAMQWFDQAAAVGNIPALYQIGLLHYQGKGTTKDFAKAKTYFEHAARLGYPAAQYNLAILFIRGEGIHQNPVEGYAWLAVARSYGYAEAQSAIAKLEKSLASYQIANAKARAETLTDEVESGKAIRAAGGEA